MAITYPLAPDEFWELCHFSGYTWDLMRFDGTNQRKDGRVVAYQYGTPKWNGSGELRPEARINDSLSLSARFGKLRGTLGSFLAYDQRRPYPLSDPTGTILDGLSLTMLDIGVDRDRVRINGLPSDFVIRAGDYMGVQYTGKYVLIRAMEDVTAVAGETPLFYVEDHVPLFVPEGLSVSMLKPCCVCKIVPGSVKHPTNDAGTASGMQFAWIQDRG